MFPNQYRASVYGITSGPKHHFFGFHDVCPWDPTERYVLAIETDFIDRPPHGPDPLRQHEADIAGICIIDTKNDNALSRVSETRAWNFQQGARLQWIPGGRDEIIYNDWRDDVHGCAKLVSVIVAMGTRRERVLEHPIYAVSPQGNFALGLDFRALVGGYAYALDRGTDSVRYSSSDFYHREKNSGIVTVNLRTGRNEGIAIRTYDVATFRHVPKPNEHHALTHISFNPAGTRIGFLDKYQLPDGGFMQRLVTANPDGSGMQVFPGHVTHFCWRNDSEILGFGKLSPRIIDLRNKGFFASPLLRPFLRLARNMRGGIKQRLAGQSYLLFTDGMDDVTRVAVGIMTEDGHPMFSPDRTRVITDTYPDANHEHALILYNWIDNTRITIETFGSLPPGFDSAWDLSEMRSDLHPRWNRKGDAVCFDSVHEGSRQLYVADITV